MSADWRYSPAARRDKPRSRFLKTSPVCVDLTLGDLMVAQKLGASRLALICYLALAVTPALAQQTPSRPGRAGAGGRAEAVRRAGRVHRPRPGARQGRSARPRPGLPRPAPVRGRRAGHEGQLLFTIEHEPFKAALDQKKAAARRRRGHAATTPRSSSSAPASSPRSNTASQAQLDQRIAEEAQARADVLEAEAQLRDAEIQLSYTEIKAPIDGRIGRAAVSPGNLVSPDSGVLATVVREDPIQRAVPGHPARAARRPPRAAATERIKVRVRLADGSFDAGNRQGRLHRRPGRRQDRRPDRARHLRQRRAAADRRPDACASSSSRQSPTRSVAIPQAAIASRPDRPLRVRRRRRATWSSSGASGSAMRATACVGRRPSGVAGRRPRHRPGPAARAAGHDGRCPVAPPAARAEAVSHDLLDSSSAGRGWPSSSPSSSRRRPHRPDGAAGGAVSRHRAAAGHGHARAIPAPRRPSSRKASRR